MMANSMSQMAAVMAEMGSNTKGFEVMRDKIGEYAAYTQNVADRVNTSVAKASNKLASGGAVVKNEQIIQGSIAVNNPKADDKHRELIVTINKVTGAIELLATKLKKDGDEDIKKVLEDIRDGLDDNSTPGIGGRMTGWRG
jgi:gas vesicle protein